MNAQVDHPWVASNDSSIIHGAPCLDSFHNHDIYFLSLLKKQNKVTIILL